MLPVVAAPLVESAPVESPAAANPFLAAAPAVSPSSASNPFLDIPIATASEPSASAPVAAPFGVASPLGAAPLGGVPAAAAQRSPDVIPPAMGAPLRVQPGVEAPNVRDPHAEFRRGTWKKPAAFILLGAAALAGLFYGVPRGEEKPQVLTPVVAKPEPGVIGQSLPPERIVDDGSELAGQTEKFQKEVEAKPTSAPPERPAGIAREGDFANAFKAAASR